LQDYYRIDLAEACRHSIHQGEAVGIWAHEGGTWRRLTSGEQRLKWSTYQNGRSACELMVRELFGLNRSQYEQIRASFERANWQSWAGIYRANRASQRPQFVVVVKVPEKNSSGVSSTGSVGGAAAGLATGIIGTALGTAYATRGRAKMNDAAAKASAQAQVAQFLATTRDTAMKEWLSTYPLSHCQTNLAATQALLSESFRQPDSVASRKFDALSKCSSAFLNCQNDSPEATPLDRINKQFAATVLALDVERANASKWFRMFDHVRRVVKTAVSALDEAQDQQKWAADVLGKIKGLSEEQKYALVHTYGLETSPYAMFNRLEKRGENEWTWLDDSVDEPRLSLMLSELWFNSRRVGDETREQLEALYQRAKEETVPVALRIMAHNKENKTRELKRYISDIKDEFYLHVLHRGISVRALKS